MVAVARLVTVVELRDADARSTSCSKAGGVTHRSFPAGWSTAEEFPEAYLSVRGMSVSARHEAELVDGRRVRGRTG